MSPARTRRRRSPDQTAGQVRERILQTFSEKAKRSGLRSVVMAELASELRMSATTLYHHFSSKDELVLALVTRWVAELASAEALTSARPELRTLSDRVRHWAQVWGASMSELSVAFIQDLQREYPEAWRIFQEGVEERKRLGAEILRPVVKPDLNANVALEILHLILARVADPKFSDRTETSRYEAIQTAVSIWASGALVQEGQLFVMPDLEVDSDDESSHEGERE
jgi:AcrR family transcriptional regulator